MPREPTTEEIGVELYAEIMRDGEIETTEPVERAVERMKSVMARHPHLTHMDAIDAYNAARAMVAAQLEELERWPGQRH
jgi:hypothetical protein